MLRHAFLRVGEDISLLHFIVPCCQLFVCFCVCLVSYCLLALPTQEGGIEGIMALFNKMDSKRELCLKVILFFQQGTIQFREIFRVKILFQKLWPLLYKRAELDLRSTKQLSSTRRERQRKQTKAFMNKFEWVKKKKKKLNVLAILQNYKGENFG